MSTKIADSEANFKWNNDYPVLTKELFWNNITKNYPKEAHKFYTWIDQYKKRNNWLKLFNGGIYYMKPSEGDLGEAQNSNGANTEAPKFHELPVAMQIGIFIQYTQEYYHMIGFFPFQEASDMESICESITEWFENNEGL